MFAGQTRSLPYIRNYAEADAYWSKTKKPPRSKKWAEDQRPLRNTSAFHYRIERHNDGGHYDLVLYHTVMARFYAPNADGRQLRMYMGHDSQTSRGFMSNVLGVREFTRFATTDGRVVIAPITGKRMADSDFSARLMFDITENRLIVAESEHTPIYKRVSNEDDKLRRKYVKDKFETLLTLCAMRIPEFETTIQGDYHKGGAFQLSGLRWQHDKAIKTIVDAFGYGNEPGPESVAVFMEVAPIIYCKLVSDRADAQKLINWHNQTCSPLALDKRVTEKDLIRSMWSTIQRIGGLKSQSGTIEYPQFPEPDQIVRSNVSTYAK